MFLFFNIYKKKNWGGGGGGGGKWVKIGKIRIMQNFHDIQDIDCFPPQFVNLHLFYEGPVDMQI